MIKQVLLTTIGCFIGIYISFAQSKQVSRELEFAKYLSTNKQYDDQIFVLKSLSRINTSSFDQKDSIHYLLGSAYYQKKVLDSAIHQYDQVSKNSGNLYTPSIFWKSYLESYLGNINESRKSLLTVNFNEKKFKSLKSFQLAGSALLMRDYGQFSQYSSLFDGEHYQFAQQEVQLQELQKGLLKHKYKSPALAGLMSAIIPGTGKIYAGKFGQGLATIIATTIMGVQTYEGYRKDGADSPRFIIYASLLSSFYVANIWGSIISVNVRKREFDDIINKEILFNMHIPLRTIFN